MNKMKIATLALAMGMTVIAACGEPSGVRDEPAPAEPRTLREKQEALLDRAAPERPEVTSAPATTAAPATMAATTTMAMAATTAATEMQSFSVDAMAVEEEAPALSRSYSRPEDWEEAASEWPPEPEPYPEPDYPEPYEPGEVTFEDYRRAGFTPTEWDDTSTFSLDADRTSFQLALNWAKSGYEIEPDSVRAEEWANSFDYDYEPPRNGDRFAITSDVVRHPLDNGKHLVRIGFQAPSREEAEGGERPVNVTLVLDASGSMSEGNRVAIARSAAEAIRRSLRPGDLISVVQFSEDVLYDLSAPHASPDDERIAHSISRLAPHGSTNVQAGLDLGVRMADMARRERPSAANYVILMSDGVANVDATDPFPILESAYDPDPSNPLRLITVGVGIANYNDVLLEQLAQYGNGWYRYLDAPEQAREVFERESWLSLSVPFADQTRAQVVWDGEAVRAWRLVGYENRVTSDRSFYENRRKFAEIPAGTATTAFYEVEVNYPAETEGGMDLGQVRLRWVDPNSGRNREQTSPVVSETGEGFSQADPLLRFGAVVALSADRYSSLPHADPDRVYTDLRRLSDHLLGLEGRLYEIPGYQDFGYVLDHLLWATA